MSDAFKNDLIDPSIVAGEQPSGTKLTAMVTQLNTAVDRLAAVIGDQYSQQSHVGAGGAYDIDLLKTAGPNLARLVGSAGWLNPRSFSRTLQSMEVIVCGEKSLWSDPPTKSGYTHYNRRQFKLPFPPIVFTANEGEARQTFDTSHNLGGSYWVKASPGGSYVDVSATKVATRVDTLNLLTGTGKYHVSDDGIITTYDPLDSNEAFKITYQFHSIPDSYDGASLNVIPDFEQTSTLCTTALVSGTTYSVTLPTYLNMRGYPTTYLSNRVTPDELVTIDSYGSNSWPSYGDQLLLPLALRNNLSSGDIIPEGYMQLWDGDAGSVVSGLEFSYVNTYTVNATGLVLEECSDRYRLIVPGATMAGTLAHVRDQSRWHDHSGRILTTRLPVFTGQRISHADLLNLADEGGTYWVGGNRPGFTTSSAGSTRNPHPMYLHRYGFKYGSTSGLEDGADDDGNRHNALLGHLCISQTDGDIGTSLDSFSLFFGNVGGPRVFFDQSESALALQYTDLYMDASVGGGDIKLSNRTRYLNILPSETASGSGEWAISVTDPTGFDEPYVAATAGGDRLLMAVHLPDGASITSAEVLVDEAASASLNAYLNYVAHDWTGEADGVQVQIASGSSAGDGSDETISISGGTLPHTVDNQLNQYFIVLNAATAADKFYGARVKYTWSQVEPTG